MYQFCGRCLRKLSSKKSMQCGFCGKCRKPVSDGQLDFLGKVASVKKVEGGKK